MTLQEQITAALAQLAQRHNVNAGGDAPPAPEPPTPARAPRRAPVVHQARPLSHPARGLPVPPKLSHPEAVKLLEGRYATDRHGARCIVLDVERAPFNMLLLVVRNVRGGSKYRVAPSDLCDVGDEP